jgi:hypothetical protein
LRTYLYDLPCKCRGFILRDPYTGEELIILNARLTHEANVEAYAHEMYHRIHGDLDSKEDVNTIETRAHALNK